MTVEEKRDVMGKDEGIGDQFPIGMRVLAVDDDPICLKVLETLLLRCQYHVTTTNQAIKALKMLRVNKDNFDLVISDVHMPDMDGFKLLELVGLEMDLPVIMLSANGETKAVMKGISHGACDYLLKPVRIEELRNVWQHVVRRKKVDHKDRYIFDNGEDNANPKAANSEDTQAVAGNEASDKNSKVNRKRKDLNEEDEDYFEETTFESEDPSGQKKSRVVWSIELHRKFVAAVNQLGIDKAVPKRILDLMNVDKLTRENVASHLQKYRLYLKRLSAVASQHASMASALGGRDATYLHKGSFNGFGNYHCLSSSGHLQGFPPFNPSELSSRTGPNLFGLPGLPLGLAQACHTQNITSNPMNDLSKFQHITAPSNQHENLLPGIPTSLELEQLHRKQKKIQESNYDLPSEVFSATGNYNFMDPTSSSILLPEISNCNEAWQSAHLLSGGNSGKTLSIRAPYSNDNIVSSYLGGNHTSSIPQLMNFKCSEYLQQNRDDLKQQNEIEPNCKLGSSSTSKVSNMCNDSQRLHNRLLNKKVDITLNSLPAFGSGFISQQDKINKVIVDCQHNFNEESMMGAKGRLGSSNCNFDELMNAVIKPEREDIGFVDGEINSDLYPLSTCM